MRIAIINHGLFPFLLGGMERHTTFLAEHLCRLGVEVDVYVPTLPPDGKQRLAAAGFKFKIIEHPWPKAAIWLRENYLYSERVGDALRADGKYDVVYCQGFNGWNYLTATDPKNRAKCIYNPHGLEMFKTHGVRQTLKHLPMRWAAEIQARHADRVVSLGGHLTAEIERYLQVSHDSVDTLPNAIDLQYVDQLLGQQSALKESRDLVFVGRLEFNKGVNLLCEAVARLPEIRLRIVGDGPLRPTLQKAYAGEQIAFLGKLDDAQLFQTYRQSGALAFASLYEGMPTVILEAMACSLPVVATDIGAVTTMVDDQNGFVVRPGSVEALGEALKSYLKLSATQRQAMGEAGRRRVVEKFTWSRVARLTLESMERLIKT